MNEDKAYKEYNKMMLKASKLREESLCGDQESRKKYNELIESQKFIELENYLIHATDK